ncbi:IS66 family insertion sequence element accessory protein TnpB [Salipiger marinus]|uniref:IS66 family insertion sequence element accessory protein TnpB n=2 Tax=Salipiger marinus TaxID=555512 RepID=UPI00363CB4CF
MASDAQTADETDALPPLAPALRRVRLHSLARYKRLEGAKFVWPRVQDGVMKMSPAQFAALFEGLDWRLVRPERVRRPELAG